ncbi:MAG: hypothetical protein EOO05_01660 [Chitinophagaceae bacterium]|nr:MAG: hypothetical protein EOO05_01660 [Chitinophagaceae bacterium]
MPSAENQQPGKKRDNLQEKIHKHLNDKNDHITDEDIRDVVVGSSADQSLTDDGRTIAEKAKEMEKEVPKDKKATPWDTLTDESGFATGS